MNTTANPQNPPLLPFDTLVRAIGEPTRCAILGKLSDGEPRTVNEIAKMIGRSPGLVSKHLAVLRSAGMVVLNRRLYQIPRNTSRRRTSGIWNSAIACCACRMTTASRRCEKFLRQRRKPQRRGKPPLGFSATKIPRSDNSPAIHGLSLPTSFFAFH